MHPLGGHEVSLLQGIAKISAADIPGHLNSSHAPACGSSEQLGQLEEMPNSSASEDHCQQQPCVGTLRNSISTGEALNTERVIQAHCVQQPIKLQAGDLMSATVDSRQENADGNLLQQGQGATLEASRGELQAGLRLDDSTAAERGKAAEIPSISGTGYLIWLPDGRLSGAVTIPPVLHLGPFTS